MKGTGEYLCENACDESEEESVNNCDECNTELDRYRDGSTDKDIRCNNCYWEDEEGNNSEYIINPDYRNLNKENEASSEIENAIKITGAKAIDISSGVEKEKGIKSIELIKKFCNVVKNIR